jgi:hypothetical protein
MGKITIVLSIICIGLMCSGGVPLAYGDWSQQWTQNYPPESEGQFTKMEFFIMPGAPVGVAFSQPTTISSSPGSSGNWISTIPNTEYSLLTDTGSAAGAATLTTFFSGPRSAVFDLDFVLWNGGQVIETQEFQWLGGYWANPSGTLLVNAAGGGQYNRNPSSVPTPIPPTILLLAPAGLGVFLLRRRPA